MRVTLRRHPPRALLPLALACQLVAGAARAAPEDLNAPQAAPDLPPGVLALGRRLLDGVKASERSVVVAFQESSAVAAVSSTWHRGVSLVTNHWPILGTGAETADEGTASASPSTGLRDISFGARLYILQSDLATRVPGVAWMADVQSADGFTLTRANALRPSVRVSAEWALPHEFSLGVMPGMVLDTDTLGRRFTNPTLALTVGKAWTPQWRSYLDLARDHFTILPGNGVATTLDVGLSFNPDASTQVDLALSHGLSVAAPVFQAGVGLSSKF